MSNQPEQLYPASSMPRSLSVYCLSGQEVYQAERFRLDGALVDCAPFAVKEKVLPALVGAMHNLHTLAKEPNRWRLYIHLVEAAQAKVVTGDLARAAWHEHATSGMIIVVFLKAKS